MNWKFIFRVLGTPALFFSVSVLVFGLHAWLTTPHMPSVVAYYIYFPLVYFSFFASIITVPASLLLLAIYLVIHKKRSSRGLVLYVLIVNITAILICQSGLFDWFAG